MRYREYKSLSHEQVIRKVDTYLKKLDEIGDFAEKRFNDIDTCLSFLIMRLPLSEREIYYEKKEEIYSKFNKNLNERKKEFRNGKGYHISAGFNVPSNSGNDGYLKIFKSALDYDLDLGFPVFSGGGDV